MKKILLSLLAFSLVWVTSVFAQENTAKLYLFWWDGCPHCEKEREFLPVLEEKYGNKLVIQQFEIWNDTKNQKLIQEVAKGFATPVNSVPLTLIGDVKIVGYGSDETTGKQIEEAVQYCLENTCADLVAPVLAAREVETKKQTEVMEQVEKPASGDTSTQVSVPFFGTVQLRDLSLPIVTVILGALDGFNPCAMWILIFLISMLIGMQDRRKMWIIGFAFIFVSALSYFLFITAWLQVMIFIGFIASIRAAIGIFALAGGSWNIYTYWKTRDSGCEIVSTKKRKKISQQIKDIIHEKNMMIALVGVAVLAFSVNLIELLCSAGLPVIFTQMLAMNDLTTAQHYLYVLLYIFFFMLDDLLVFIISMVTLEAFGITTKYTKYSHLVGGILMLIIGFLLIFRPEVLMFG